MHDVHGAYRKEILRHIALMTIDGGPPPLGLCAVALAIDLEAFALDEGQLVRVFSLVVARRVDDAVVGNTQLAD